MDRPPDPLPAEPRPTEASSGLGQVIPTKNPSALIGYYLGVFSLIPALGAALALAAVPLGIAGLRNVARQPGLPGRVHAWVAIVLGSFSLLGHLAVFAFVLSSRR